MSEKHPNWKNGMQVTLLENRKTFNVGLNVVNNRARFSAGWNAFIREGNLKAGDRLEFKLSTDGKIMDVEIKRKVNVRRN